MYRGTVDAVEHLGALHTPARTHRLDEVLDAALAPPVERPVAASPDAAASAPFDELPTELSGELPGERSTDPANGWAAAPEPGPGAPGRIVARRRRRQVLVASELMLIDAAAALIAMCAGFVFRFGLPHAGNSVADLAATGLIPLAWIGAVAVAGGYDSRFTGVGATEFVRIFRSFLYLTVLTTFVAYLAHLDIARGFLVGALPLVMVFSLVGRALARRRLRRLRRAGRAMNRVLAVGSSASVLRLAEDMARDISAGLHVVGACLPADEIGDVHAVTALHERGIPVLGPVSEVRASVLESKARSVAVVPGDIGTRAARTLAWELERSGADLIVSSGLSEVAGRRVHVQTVAGTPILRVDEPSFDGFRRALKGGFDRTVAAVLLLMLSPLLLALAAVVRATSRGPAFFLQTRVGRDGQIFRMVKFRSMYAGSDQRLAEIAHLNESGDGLLFKIREDPRVTGVGRVLRRFSLDELPQLINVLVGSMSLVGPRPPLPLEVAAYGEDVRRRLLVKPGLTGLWQVSGRSDLSWEDSVRLDLHYVENWSFGLDMLVLLRTAGVVLRATGAY